MAEKIYTQAALDVAIMAERNACAALAFSEADHWESLANKAGQMGREYIAEIRNAQANIARGLALSIQNRK